MDSETIEEILKQSRIDIDLYAEKIYFIFNRDDYDSVLDYFQIDRLDKHSYGHTLPLKDIDGDSWAFIAVLDGTVGTLAHELSHYCFVLLNQKGISTNMNESEPFAYLMGYLFEKCYSKMKKVNA